MRLRALLRHLPVKRFRNPPPVVAVVPLAGLIGRLGPFTRGLTLSGVAASLKRAFQMDGVKAVALVINSPGGSPVQSALIARRVRALAAEHEVPVYTFAEDVAASGGYWLLAAGDELHAEETSIVGSIGVVSGGFGFPEALQRLGIERRLYTSGAHKAALDPFQPEKAEEVAHLRGLLEETHEAFRRWVRERRGDRLTGDEAEVFSGRFWAGGTALSLGLIDGLGDVRTVMRKKFGEKVKLRMVTEGRPWWRRRLGLPGVGESRPADRLGDLAGARGGAADLAQGLLGALEERLTWSRYGL